MESHLPEGFPSDSRGYKQQVKNLPAQAGDPGVIPGGEDPLEKEMATHSSIRAWRIPMDRGAWWATAHRVIENQTRLEQLGTQQPLAPP